MVMSAERFERIRKMVLSHAEHEREVIKQAVGDVPLGSEELSDEQVMRFMELKVRDHPRTLITLPPENEDDEDEEGRTVYASPYLVALEIVAQNDPEAKNLFERYMKLVES